MKYFRQESPYKAITLRLRLPDYRHKCESERFLREVQDYMTMELDNFRQFQMLYATQYQGQVKVLRDIINRVMDKIKESLESHRLEYQGPKEPTQWDVKRLLYLQDYFVGLTF